MFRFREREREGRGNGGTAAGRWARAVCVLLAAGALSAAALGQERMDREARRTPVVRVFEACRDAVVNISTTRVQRVRSLRADSVFDEIFGTGRPYTRAREIHAVGSGFIVHPSGYVVTNAHVVAQTSDIQISFADGRSVPARVVATDPEHDLAVLKIESGGPVPALSLARSDDIMIGETVVAIGNPLGYQHTVTTGIVSALDRELRFGPDNVYKGLIQTDTAINPGNSGGPLLNINGELIGINTAIRGDAQNVCFAIPVDQLWELLPDMLDLERRERVRLGLKVAGREARVTQVRAGTPAAAAGLKVGDRITAFNGERVANGIDYYVHLLSQRPGAELALSYQREGAAEQTARVKLEVIPPPDGNRLAEKLLGVRLEPLPANVARRFNLSTDAGLLVSEVQPRSPADRAGLEPGDLIARIDRLAVDKLETLGLVLEAVPAGETLTLEGARLHADPPFVWTVAVPTR